MSFIAAALTEGLALWKLVGRFQKELPELVKQAEVDRGAGWVREVCAEYPEATQVIKEALSGTPDEVICSLQPYVDLADIPGVEKFIAQLQLSLKDFLQKPRPWLGPKRRG